MMDILMSEKCWAHKKWNKIASDIKLVFHSTITMMHVAINIRFTNAKQAKIIHVFSDSVLDISEKVYCLKTQLWLTVQFFTWYSSAVTTVTCWVGLLNVMLQLKCLSFSDVIRSSNDESYESSSCRFTRHEVTGLNGVLHTQFSLFNLDTRWKWSVSLTPHPLYTHGKKTAVSTEWSLG